MKKDTILGFIALIILVFALRSVANEAYCPSCPQEQVEDDIDCQECCRQGRFASEECFRKCGGCCAYSDEACAEYNDFPTN